MELERLHFPSVMRNLFCVTGMLIEITVVDWQFTTTCLVYSLICITCMTFLNPYNNFESINLKYIIIVELPTSHRQI